MDLVTVASFSSYFDMHLIKGRLEAEGIPCIVVGENHVTILPIYDIALGGIRLQVRAQDADAAKEILKDTDYNKTGSLTTFNTFNQIGKARSVLRIVMIVFFLLLVLLAAL